MPRSQTNPLRFWSLLAFALLVAAACVGLGFWQLDRAAEKTAMLEAIRQARQHPLSAAELFSKPAPSAYYRRVELPGRFLADPVLLLDNRIRNGRAGYEQLQFFRVRGEQRLLLVNRGWIAEPGAATPAANVTIRAEQYPLPRPGLDLAVGMAAEARDGYWLLQRVDFEQIAQQFDREPLPALFRLVDDSVAGLDLDWPPLPMGPARHQAYAVQWFTMALAIGLLSAGLCWKRREETDEENGAR